jgi:hypothetical protein
MTARPIVADTYQVPEVVVLADFRLELLGPRHNEPDHAAWMSSIEHIRSTPGFDGDWPPVDGMTLAQNLADLESHAERSARRVDFAYSVIDVPSGQVIGCVYFKPSPSAENEVEALSWVCATRADLDEPLTVAVGEWLQQAWPFELVRYRLGRIPVEIRSKTAH